MRVTIDGYYGAIEQTIAVQYAIDGKLTADYATDIVEGSVVSVIPMQLLDTSTGTVLVQNMDCASVVYADATSITGGYVPVISEGKFNALYAGKYTVTYSATYNEKQYTKEVEISVARASARPDEVESFDSPVSCDGLEGNHIDSKTWLSEYKGESGVAKLTCVGENKWPEIRFTPRQSMTAYEGYDYIVLRMYITGGIPDDIYFTNDDEINDSVKKKAVVKDAWHDYVFDISAFKKHWKDKDGGGFTLSDKAKVCLYSGTTGDVQIYIADISVRKAEQ